LLACNDDATSGPSAYSPAFTQQAMTELVITMLPPLLIATPNRQFRIRTLSIAMSILAAPAGGAWEMAVPVMFLIVVLVTSKLPPPERVSSMPRPGEPKLPSIRQSSTWTLLPAEAAPPTIRIPLVP